MRPILLIAVFALPFALAACGVPDVVAHGVKQYQKSSDQPEPVRSEENRRQDGPPPVVRRGQPVAPTGAAPVSAAPAPAAEPEASGPLLPRPEAVQAEPLR